MPRDWFWELAAAGHGPDHFCYATVAPAAAARLAAWVRRAPLLGFVYQRVHAAPSLRHQQTSDYDLYVDAANAAQFAANLAGDQPRNLWVYHAIEVCGTDLTIMRGYGGYPAAHGATETGLLLGLAATPGLTLIRWAVGYGGEGYGGAEVTSGTSAAELQRYLDA